MPLYYKRFPKFFRFRPSTLCGSGATGVSEPDGRQVRRDTGVSVQPNPATHHGVANEYPAIED